MNSRSERDQTIQKLAELIGDIRIGMLTTVADDGALWSRPITTQRPKFDGDLWFITKAESSKVREMHQHRQVSLSYVRMEDNTYVSLSGTARVTSDPEKAKELWDESYWNWFPGGTNDPSLAVIRVVVERAEYWDAPYLTWPTEAGFLVLAPEQISDPKFHAKIVFKRSDA